MNNICDLGCFFEGTHESDWRLMKPLLQKLSLDPLKTLSQRVLPPTNQKMGLLLVFWIKEKGYKDLEELKKRADVATVVDKSSWIICAVSAPTQLHPDGDVYIVIIIKKSPFF